MPKASSKQYSDKEYERLGRMIAEIYESSYIDRRRTYKMSFVKGVLAGFGGLIGATVVVTLVLWFLSFFKTVPLVDKVVHNIEQTTQQSK